MCLLRKNIKHADAYEKDIVYVTTDTITADKCRVIDTYMQYPRKVLVRSFITGKKYSVYPEWHCYKTKKDAKMAARKYKEGYKDIIR